MKLPVRGFKKPLDVKWLVRIPLYGTVVIAAWATAATLRAKDWDPLAWQAIVFAVVLLIVLVWLVITPLLVVEQLLAEKEKERAH